MKVPDKKPNELRKEQDDFANKVLRNLKHDYGDMADKLFDFNLQPKFGIKRTGKAKIPSWFMYYEIQVSRNVHSAIMIRRSMFGVLQDPEKDVKVVVQCFPGLVKHIISKN